MAEPVTIFEVGPRDGLQNEARLIPATDKIRLVDFLSQTGLQKIEVTSFVSPKWVPQLADAAEVLAGISRAPGVSYAALTPNLRGFEGAVAGGVDEIAIFASASEGFSRANINCTIAESFERFRPICEAAAEIGLKVRGYISCVTDCPYDGKIVPDKVLYVADTLLDMGCYEVSLGDTIGAATPPSVSALLECLVRRIETRRLAGHFHDTNGRALDNIRVSLDFGLRVFDSSVAGLGGCPYAPGAKGNVATEGVCALLTDLGYETGVDAGRLAEAAAFARTLRQAD